MTLVFLVAIGTLPLVLVTALLGSNMCSSTARVNQEAMFVPLRCALRDLVASGMPKERIVRVAAAELRLIAKGAK
jgi:hypothetical protein